jgi:hypothetical protein
MVDFAAQTGKMTPNKPRGRFLVAPRGAMTLTSNAKPRK